MTDCAREMTLREWVDTLPKSHSARRELAELEREVSEAREGADAAIAMWHERAITAERDLEEVRKELR